MPIDKVKAKLMIIAFMFYGGLWQIWECIMAMMNNWGYAFPFKIIILYKGDIWIALDFWIVICAMSFVLGVSNVRD